MEYLIKARYILLSSARWAIYKLAYGGSFLGPFVGAGPGTNIRIRRNGRLFFGGMKTRGQVFIFCDGGELSIGEGVFLNRGVSINCMQSISIGHNTLFGEGVKVYDHDHIIAEGYRVSHVQFVCASISIGSGCWFGSNVIVLKGVSVADNTIVAAGSVITRSITEAGVYAGIGNGVRRIR